MFYMFIVFGSTPSETAPGENYFYAHAAGHIGVFVCQNSLPRHLYEGGGGTEN